MNKLQYHENKTLKLSNVLKYKILLEDYNYTIFVDNNREEDYMTADGIYIEDGGDTALRKKVYATVWNIL